MSSRLSLTIKDFHTRGGNLTMKITSAVMSVKMVGATQVPKLIITRQPSYYSSYFARLAYLQKTKPGNQDSHFPQLTLTVKKCDASGNLLSMTLIDFFYVVVDDVKANGSEEELTFLADRKSGDFTISNVEVWFD